MMEESGDDANGDSTFEFVGDKDAVPPVDPAQAKTGVPESGDRDDAPHPTAPMDEPRVPATLPSEAEPIRSAHYQPKPNQQAIPSFHQAAPPITNPLLSSPYPTSVLPVYSAPGQAPLVMGGQPYGAVPLAGPSVQPVCNQGPHIPLTTVYAPVVPPVQSYQPQGTQYLPPQPPVPAGNPSFTVTLPTDYDRTSGYASAAPHDGGGVWGWFRGNEFLSKVAEKAKNSVDSMITTLDPGMKEYIYSGGDVDVVVASDEEVKVSAVREAFQRTFGRASVTGVAAQPSNVAVQPVGFAAGLKAAEDRIVSLQQAGRVQRGQPLVAVESFVVELTPDCWYDLACLVLRDDGAGIGLHTFGQATPVPAAIAAELQDRTPPDYPLRWSGFSLAVGEVAGARLGVPHAQWHEALGGIPRSQLLLAAACTLATMYKAALNR